MTIRMRVRMRASLFFFMMVVLCLGVFLFSDGGQDQAKDDDQSRRHQDVHQLPSESLVDDLVGIEEADLELAGANVIMAVGLLSERNFISLLSSISAVMRLA